MPNMCTVCRRPNVGEINKALLDGGPLRSIADQWSVSKTALIRHRVHLPRALLKAKAAAEVLDAENLMAKVRELERSALRIATAAEASQDLRTALIGIRELRGLVELLARITGKLDGDPAGSGGATRSITINFPVISAADLEAVNNAPVIDLPPMARRLLARPSDGHQR